MVWVYLVFRRMFSVYEKTLSVRENRALSLDKRNSIPHWNFILKQITGCFHGMFFHKYFLQKKSLTCSVWVAFTLCPTEYCQPQTHTQKPPRVRHLNHHKTSYKRVKKEKKATGTKVAPWFRFMFMNFRIYLSDVSKLFSASRKVQEMWALLFWWSDIDSSQAFVGRGSHCFLAFWRHFSATLPPLSADRLW